MAAALKSASGDLSKDQNLLKMCTLGRKRRGIGKKSNPTAFKLSVIMKGLISKYLKMSAAHAIAFKSCLNPTNYEK